MRRKISFIVAVLGAPGLEWGRLKAFGAWAGGTRLENIDAFLNQGAKRHKKTTKLMREWWCRRRRPADYRCPGSPLMRRGRGSPLPPPSPSSWRLTSPALGLYTRRVNAATPSPTLCCSGGVAREIVVVSLVCQSIVCVEMNRCCPSFSQVASGFQHHLCKSYLIMELRPKLLASSRLPCLGKQSVREGL